jgi:Tfp pilus assembly protein PilF
MGCGGPSLPGAQSPERQSEAEYDVAREYFYKGQLRTALDHTQKAIALDADNAKALYFASIVTLAFCSGAEGTKSADCRLNESESYARKALEKDAQFRDARNALGQILILEDKNAEAVEILKPLVADPAYSAVHLAWGNYGWAQVRAGALDEGIASLKNSVTQPKFCVGFYRLGWAYEKKGDLAQAESNFTQAVQVDAPECQELQDAWLHRGTVRIRLGKSAEACADLARCKEISADSEAGKQCVQQQTAAKCS